MERRINSVLRVFLSIALIVSFMPAFSQIAYADDVTVQEEATQSQESTNDQAMLGETADQAAERPLGFVYFGESDLTAGAVQQVAVAIDDDALTVESATLVFKDPRGVSHEVAASVCADQAALFSVQTSGPGSYQLVELRAETRNTAGEAITVQVDLAQEGENTAFVAQPDQGMVLSTQEEDETEDGDMTIYAFDEDGDIVTADSLDGVAALAGALEITTQDNNTPAGKFVIALDPGHGGSDPGALGNGLKESEINWKIAQACKAELEKYSNVEVYVTRTQNECPGLEERAERAKQHGAKVFVSLHINSGGGTGAEVYYPNDSSYLKETTHQVGKELAQNVLDQLVALGLTKRGIKVRNSANGSKYADGSTRDYYSVIAASRERGIPGVIVEHAFIDTAADNKLLADNSFLQKLGVADATGIAKTFGLAKDGNWEQLANGTWKYKKTNGEYVKNSWVTVNNSRYYLDADGIMLTGLQKIDGNVYYLDASGALDTRSGWMQIDGTWYWGSGSGTMTTGWVKSGNKWYYLSPETAAMCTGWVTVDGKKYYLNAPNGDMRTGGWFLDGNTWYWINGGGDAATGWIKTGGKWYYLDPASAAMRTGWIHDGTAWYYLNAPNGDMRTGGWFLNGNKWYWLNGSGAAQHGWLKTGGKWYYLDPADADMKTGWVTVDGKKYYLNSPNGDMRTAGWFLDGDTWYWINGGGDAATGWIKTGGKWYYLDAETAAMHTGWTLVDNTWYYLEPSNGDMKTGWLKLGDTWYYLNGSGAMLTGWQTIGGKQYYLDSEGKMLSGQQVIDGEQCFFEGSGAFVGHGTPIMGVSQTSVARMTQAYLASGKTYPSATLAAGGAPDPATFCQIIYDEANAEGVRAEVVWAQVMLETGWLQMGGDVKLSQYNFAGLGATGGGVAGNGFPDVRTGIRAQVQHLKCYASDAALNNERVDPRWSSNLRNKAKLVEWLGIQENPYGTGWAAGAQYGYKLTNLMSSYLGI